MVRVGVIALDGTKIAANVSMLANWSEDTLRKMAAQVLKEARRCPADHVAVMAPS